MPNMLVPHHYQSRQWSYILHSFSMFSTIPMSKNWKQIQVFEARKYDRVGFFKLRIAAKCSQTCIGWCLISPNAELTSSVNPIFNQKSWLVAVRPLTTMGHLNNVTDAFVGTSVLMQLVTSSQVSIGGVRDVRHKNVMHKYVRHNGQ